MPREPFTPYQNRGMDPKPYRGMSTPHRHISPPAPFKVGGEKLMFPGDTSCGASGWNIYNCRCGMRTMEKEGIEAEPRQMRVKNPATGKYELVNEMTYSEWAEWKKSLANSEESDKLKVGLQFFAAKIPEEKFTQYALNPMKDANKAKTFREALGYTLENYSDLMHNIESNLDESRFVEKGDSGHGMRYEYIVELTGPNGKKANVLTAWIQEGGEKRMTSVYVTKRSVTK